MPDGDPRIGIMIEALTSAGGNELMPHDQLVQAAEIYLADLDAHSPDITIARLQRELTQAWGGDDWSNIDRAQQIVERIDTCRKIHGELKRAFAYDALDGGYAAAYEHPLWAQAAAEETSLREELKGLI